MENGTTDLDLVEVFQANGTSGEMAAMGVSNVLDASGIENFVSGSSQMPNLPYTVMVARDHEERARAVIAEAELAGPGAAEEAEKAYEAEAAGLL